MCNSKTFIPFLMMTSFMVACFLLIPCSFSEAQQAGSRAQSVPLPVYQKGTTFVYSNGTWETVISSSPHLVTWENYRGYVSSGSPDFTRRRTEWQTRTRQGTRQFESRKDLWFKKKTTLWPLRIGNEATYTEISTQRRQGKTETTARYNWACEVAGTERISVMAGEFDTWKIVCKRYPGKDVSTKSKVREITTWYYAPVVGHYVLTTRISFSGQPAQRLELLAVLPPLDVFSTAARTKMSATFQKAMEFKKSGESVLWSISSSAFAGEITPTATFRLANGSYSRRYIQKLKLPDGQRIYYGMAVRDTSGVWVIPRN